MANSDVMGELFIWTDIDPAHEADFNRWHDREHMAERAAIPGFMWARRYRARRAAPRYLALYRTESLSVFTSEAYRQAFSQQTAWSLANFGRMRNTRRRVMAVTPLGGYGTGALLVLIPGAPAPAALRDVLAVDGCSPCGGSNPTLPCPRPCPPKRPPRACWRRSAWSKPPRPRPRRRFAAGIPTHRSSTCSGICNRPSCRRPGHPRNYPQASLLLVLNQFRHPRMQRPPRPVHPSGIANRSCSIPT